MKANLPLVSVAMTTYNHEYYLIDALESAINQRTEFCYEIIIGEDYSTDRTREIVKTYHKSHPELIKPIFQTENIGARLNFESVLYNCSGKYLAILEGDDYWINKDKLQIQVDFLENHPDYSACFHNAKIIQGTRKRKIRSYCEFKEDQSFSLNEMLKSNFIPTASVMFRNCLNEDFIARIRTVDASDWFIHVYNAERGKIYYFNKFMSVYRVHQNGLWSGLNDKDRIRFGIDTIFDMNRAFNYKYEKEFKNNLVGYAASLKGDVNL